MKTLVILFVIMNLTMTVKAQIAKLPDVLKQKCYVFFNTDDLFFSCQNAAFNITTTGIKEKDPTARTIMVVNFEDDVETELLEYAKQYYIVDTVIADKGDMISTFYNVYSYPTYLELDAQGREVARHDGMHFEIVTETVKLLDSIARVQQSRSIFINETIPLSRAFDAKIGSDKNLYVCDEKLGSVACIGLSDGKIIRYSSPDVGSMRSLYSDQQLSDSTAWLRQIKKGLVFFPTYREFVCDSSGTPLFLKADYVKEILSTQSGSRSSLSPAVEDVLLPFNSDNPLRKIVEINPLYRDVRYDALTLINPPSLFVAETRITNKNNTLNEDMILGILNTSSQKLTSILIKSAYKKVMGAEWKSDYQNQAFSCRSSSEVVYCSMVQPCLLSISISDKPAVRRLKADGELGDYFDSLNIWQKGKTSVNEQYTMKLTGMTIQKDQLYMAFTQAPASEVRESMQPDAVILQSYNLDSGTFREWNITPLLINDILLQVRFAGIDGQDAIFLYKWNVKRWEIRRISLSALDKIVQR